MTAEELQKLVKTITKAQIGVLAHGRAGVLYKRRRQKRTVHKAMHYGLVTWGGQQDWYPITDLGRAVLALVEERDGPFDSLDLYAALHPVGRPEGWGRPRL